MTVAYYRWCIVGSVVLCLQTQEREASLVPRPSMHRFYLAVVEKNWGVRPGISYHVCDTGEDALDHYEDWKRASCDSLAAKGPQE